MGDAFRVGLGGPVGAGKTSLTASLCKVFSETLSMAVITNDIYTKEDAEILMRKQVINSKRILAVETGGCPHTAIREDASINLQAVDKLSNQFPDLDLILLESGGDNLSATFSPELVDYTIFMIDVCMGEEIPRKGGPAIKFGNNGHEKCFSKMFRRICGSNDCSWDRVNCIQGSKRNTSIIYR